MAATAYVLVRGVIGMASGKDVTGEQSAEVDAQARAVPGGRDHHRHPDPRRRGLRAAKASRLVKLNKIYTRTGDGGSAGLVDGSRVSKASRA